MKAWHFSEATMRLRYNDNRLIVPGETHKVDCEPKLCNAGLHASENIVDALGFAHGPILWRVELGGKIVKGDDKACATERTYLWGVDASECLRAFARECALDVIHLLDAPEVVMRYLKTGDESIRAAAMYAAARDAAWDAARDAAALATASAAAMYAAASDAAREKQSRRLLAMVRKLPRIGATP